MSLINAIKTLPRGFRPVAIERFLPHVFATAWCADTSSDPLGWTAFNPAWGQCAVTALVLHDLYGGEIVWAQATLPDGTAVSHYFNVIDGQEVDLTRRQFPRGTHIPKGTARQEGVDTRAYILSHAKTAARYGKLRHLMGLTGQRA